MEIVFKSNDLNEVFEISRRLEDKGIPCRVNENDLRNRGSHIPDGNEVWIYLNEQYADAVKLIESPNHVVKHVVDIGEFYNQISDDEAKVVVNEYASKFVKYGAILIVCVFFGVFILIKLKT